jgi:hypothetical protein
MPTHHSIPNSTQPINTSRATFGKLDGTTRRSAITSLPRTRDVAARQPGSTERYRVICRLLPDASKTVALPTFIELL